MFLIKATTTQYFIPLSITIWLYIKIGYIVSKQGIIAGQSTDERKRIQSEARKRRIIMLVLVGKKNNFLMIESIDFCLNQSKQSKSRIQRITKNYKEFAHKYKGIRIQRIRIYSHFILEINSDNENILNFISVAAFAICWLPLNLYHLLVDFKLINRHFNIFLLCHWFAMSSVW